MKKIFNAPEVKLITINHDVIATSGEAHFNAKMSDGVQLVGARDYYEDEEEIW